MGLLLASLLSGCSLHHPRDARSLLPEGDLVIIGHRGARGVAPENTPAAFQVAADLGLPIETDVRLCASGEAVILHDGTLDRTTSGTGDVAKRTLAELKALEAGALFGDAWPGQRILTLDEFLDAHGNLPFLDIEAKSAQGTDNAALAEAIVRAVEARGMVERVLVTSFSPYLLEQVRVRNPAILRGQIYSDFHDEETLAGYEKFALRHLLLNKKSIPDVLVMEAGLATPRYVRRMKEKGYRVVVWTVNDPDTAAEVRAAGVDAIITDFPAAMLRWTRTPPR